MPERDAQTPDGRDTRWSAHRAARRDLVLRTAVTALEQDGTGVGVAAIAARAGIPRSVVYRLFRDREDLDEQVRARILDDLKVALAPALDPRGGVRDAIRAATEGYVGWVAQHPRLHQFLGGPPGRPGSRAATGTRTAIALNLTRLVDLHLASLAADKGLPAGTSENLAFGMVGLVDGAVNRWVSHPGPRCSAEELTSFLSGALWGVLIAEANRWGIEVPPDLPAAPA